MSNKQSETIPFVDLKAQYRLIQEDIQKGIQGVLERADFIKGEAVSQFEKDFAQLIGVKHCIAVDNGTSALSIALKTLGIGLNDEVLTVANSFIATSESISQVGGRPVFVDCNEATYTIDLLLLEKAIEKGMSQKRPIKAILPVHLYGRAAPMKEICQLAHKYDLKVLEDCAQSHLAAIDGQCTGTFGDMATFSFFPGKNLGAYGDAGAIVTNNDEYARYARMYANHGRIAKYNHEFEGVNARMDTLQAVILNVKLPHLKEWTKQRQRNADLYRKYLSNISDIKLPEKTKEGEHVYHLFVIQTDKRDFLLKHLNEAGIAAAVHYPIALPNLAAYSYLEHKPSDFPVSSSLQDKILSLPMYPELTEEQIQFVCKTLKSGLEHHV